MTNLRKVDNFIQSKRGLTNDTMTGANSKRVNGQTTSSKVFDSLSGDNLSNSVINFVTNRHPIASLIKDSIDKKEDK